MNCKPTIFFATALLFAACHSGRDRLLTQFDSVNKSLAASNAAIGSDNALALLNQSIQLKKDRNPALAAQADSIYQLASDAVILIQRYRTRLTDADSSGESTAPAKLLLVHTAAGDSLRQSLIRLAAFDPTPRSNGPSLRDNNWSALYFYNTPTVAALTILAKFESDCRKSGIADLTKINNRL